MRQVRMRKKIRRSSAPNASSQAARRPMIQRDRRSILRLTPPASPAGNAGRDRHREHHGGDLVERRDRRAGEPAHQDVDHGDARGDQHAEHADEGDRPRERDAELLQLARERSDVRSSDACGRLRRVGHWRPCELAAGLLEAIQTRSQGIVPRRLLRSRARRRPRRGTLPAPWRRRARSAPIRRRSARAASSTRLPARG